MRWLSILVLMAAAGPGLGQGTPPLFTEMGEVTPFTLVDSTGKPFTPEQLRGKIWIAHFFFTTCTQGCEKTIARMQAIQEAIRGKSDLALVSISVNPSNDSPELLSAFARDLKAEPGQWHFVTGKHDDVLKTVQQSFFQTAIHDPSAPKDKQITHGFNLLIVDRDGRIVGYTDGREERSVAPLLERVRSLASQRYILPSVNATLNALAGFLLAIGYLAIRSRRIRMHKIVMLSALACSAIFLASYLFYHFAVLRGVSPRLVGPGNVRLVYLAILLTHTILAIVVAPLAIFVTYQGLTNNLARHVRVARWTLPIWMYVSVTGVVVYWMLYHLYPPY